MSEYMRGRARVLREAAVSAVLREVCFILREKALMHGDVCGPCSDCRLEPYLQSLIRPSLDPRSGRALAMREANAARHGEEFVYLSDDWRMRFYDRADHLCGPWDLERRMRDDWRAGVETGPSIALLAFEAGRRYEREGGCAYVSDKPWTRQS